MRIKQEQAPIVFVAALLAAFATAAVPARAQYSTYYVTMAVDGPDMVVEGITDTNYYMGGIHTAYATVRVRRPTGAESVLSAFESPRVRTIIRVPIDDDDGLWSATNEAWDWCPIGLVSTWFGLAYAEQEVPSFVKLVRAQFTPSTIYRSNAQTTLGVDLVTSRNCNGTVWVTATLSRPPNMDVTINDGFPTATDEIAMTSGDSKTIAFVVKTGGNNTITGRVAATTYISSKPSTCEIKGPDCSGCTAGPTLTVE